MTSEKTKLQAGVWIDHHRAVLITAPAGQYAVQQSIETTAPEHHRSSEFAINNAAHALAEKHFHSVAAHLVGFDDIYLFGPGTAQLEMKNILAADHHFAGKHIEVGSVDNLTHDQMVEKVREHFEHAA